MQSVDFKQIDELNSDIADLLEKFPEMRRKLHGEFADVIKRRVDIEIGMTIDDSQGEVKRWQTKYVGSGGGYAAVRAVDTSTGNESPGAITNYLESGHKIRRPTGTNKRYRPRIKKIYVDGRHFYERASKTIEAEIISIAEDFADEIIKNLE